MFKQNILNNRNTDLVKNSHDVRTAFSDVPISLIVLISDLAAGGLSR